METLRTIPVLVLTIAVAIGAANPKSGFAASSEGSKSPEAAAGTLPKDIYPDSRNRLPTVKRADLDAQGKKAYDRAVSDPRSLAGLRGPSGILLHSPRYAEYGARASEYLRFENGLGPRLTQLVFLVAAREVDSQFEWTAHEPAARKAGLEQNIIDVVKYRKPLTGLGEKEAAIIQIGREVFRKHKVSSKTFAHALKLFGTEKLVNLVSLMGYQSQIAVLLATFDQQIPPGKKPLLPLP